MQKHAVVVKTQQKEVQTATLELGMLEAHSVDVLTPYFHPQEQLEKDIQTGKDNIAGATVGIQKLQKELGKQREQLVVSEASFRSCATILRVNTSMFPELSGGLCESRGKTSARTSNPHPVRKRAEGTRRSNQGKEVGRTRGSAEV